MRGAVVTQSGGPHGSGCAAPASAIRFFADRLPRVADFAGGGTPKTALPASEWPTCAAATAVVTDYLEAFYNPRRRHPSLDDLSPVDFELRLARQRATA